MGSWTQGGGGGGRGGGVCGAKCVGEGSSS